MAKFSRLAGATSQSVNVFIQNSSSTTGAGLTGLVFSTASLTAYYTFSGASTASTQITLVTLATLATAYTSGGFKEVDSTHMPGVYRLDLPNAMLAASSGNTVLGYLQGATNMAPVVLEIELTSVDNQSTAYGLSIAKTTNITGFNDIAATAIVSGGAITTSSGAVSTVTTTTTATNLTNAPTAGDFTSTMKASITTAATAATPTVTVGTVAGAASNIKKDQALPGFTFLMTDSTAHTPKTGLTITGQASLNGGTLGSLTNSATEIGNGIYTINLAAADLNANTVLLRFTASSADDRDILIITQP